MQQLIEIKMSEDVRKTGTIELIKDMTQNGDIYSKTI